MKWFHNIELSDEDFELLRGTEVMIALQRHRLVVVSEPKEEWMNDIDLHELGLVGFFYVREINSETHELFFEQFEDLELFKQHLIQHRMSAD
jgi:hypothetical protein